MKTIFAASLGLVLALLAGCYAQSQIYSDQLEGIEMSAYKTYAWLPTAGDSASLMNNEILQSNLMNEIDRQLQVRGYSADGQNPDLLVLMHLRFDEQTEVFREPIYGSYDYVYPVAMIGNYPYYYNSYQRVTYIDGYQMDSVTYTEGSVVVDLIDAESNKLVWRGWSERVMDPDTYRRTLTDDVQSIFRQFPVQPVGKDYSAR